MKEQNDLVALIRLALRHRRPIVRWTAIAAFVAVVLSLLLPLRYKAAVTLVRTTSSSGGFQSILQSDNLTPLIGSLMGASTSMNSESNLLIILESYTLAKSMIEKHKLMGDLHPFRWNTGKNRWRIQRWSVPFERTVEKFHDKVLTVRALDTGLIVVEIELRDPKKAAVVAADMVEALQAFINKSVLTQSKRNRMFIEGQLAQARVDLADMEVLLKDFENLHNIYSIDTQMTLALETYSSVKSEMIANEIKLREIGQTYGEDNPSFLKLKIANRSLDKQLRDMETKKNLKDGRRVGIFSALNEVPDLKLQYLRLRRDVMVREKVFGLLMEQYEMARVEEHRDEPSFQVVDAAFPPGEKSRPRRAMIVLVTIFLSALTGLLGAAFKENVLPKLREDNVLPR